MMQQDDLRALIEQTRSRILSAKDRVCLERARLVTEAYERFDADPVPLRRARALDHVLRNMTLDLETNPVFAGNTSTGPRAWMLLPEYGFSVPGQAVVENPKFEGFLDGNAVPEDLRAFWKDRSAGGAAGIGHLAVDLQTLLSKGLNHIIAVAEADYGDADPGSAIYRKACAPACRAVVAWAERYADEAEHKANATADPVVAVAHERVAEACRQVPASPPRDFFEALQSVALVHLAIHVEGHGYSVSPGRLDQILLPYYRGEEEAAELIAAFWLKLSANSLWGSHSKTQCITIGGSDPDGRDCCNPLTALFLEAAELVRMPDPHLFLRWHANMPPAIKHRACEMLGRGFSMPLLIGDEQTVTGLANAGIDPRDAQDYCVVGCNELGIPGTLMCDPLSINGAALLRELLLDADRRRRMTGMDSLIDELEAAAEADLHKRLTWRQRHAEHLLRTVPTPFTSSLMADCVRLGRDMHERMAYPHWTLFEQGFTNLVNALAAIEHAVFETRAATLEQLADALEKDFSGCDELLAGIRAAPKWGNDDERADRWALQWLEIRDAACERAREATGAPPILNCHVVRSLHHLLGRGIGATPDGRMAGEPLADSVGAPVGTALGGPTAMLSSVCKLRPAKHWSGGYNLNLTLPPTAAASASERRNLEGMVEAFFASGGQEIQVAVFDPAVLEEAMERPERHADLLVRVSGFNARFVDLSRCEQTELLTRAKAAT